MDSREDNDDTISQISASQADEKEAKFLYFDDNESIISDSISTLSDST